MLIRYFPESYHVRDIGLKAADDPFVWDYAKNNRFIIASKDADMHDFSLALGNPPKVIGLRLGNCSTSDLENVLRRNFDAIKVFYEDESVSLLALP